MQRFDASILDRTGTVLIDDREPGRAVGRSFLLSDPEEIIVAQSTDEAPDALSQMDERLAAGRFVAGFIAYDAGLVLDKVIASRHRVRGPVVWLGVYRDCEAFDAREVDLGEVGDVADIGEPTLNIDEDEYLERVARAKDYIHAGDVYQINYTCKLRFEHTAPARRLFARLRAAHPVCHSAFINMGDTQIVSLSPELFLRREGWRVATRPMKGTMRRGRWADEDDALARSLAEDVKNRAENVMIVDLMRNDLGRVCETGSVEVPRLFEVERYASLLQMTGDVEGDLREGVTAGRLLRATFPPGSITGAPKIHAMEIIDELEHESRGVYCGAIGLFRPGGDCLLNVAIRTIVQRGDQCEMGAGSGIVADSVPEAELAETRLKGRFLFAERPDFRLIETLLWTKGGGYRLLEEHLSRMARSARYFGWEFAETRLREALASAHHSTNQARVRLLLDANGACETQSTPLLDTPTEAARILLADRRTDPSDLFLYHKTTRREGYDADWRAAHDRGYLDLLYLNTRGELTEGAITNVMVEIDGQWWTPPLECGLLPGTWRATRLAEGDVAERVLTLDDLRRATRVVMGNSVRGGAQIERIDGPDGVVWRR